MTLRSVRQIARKRPEQEFLLNRLYGAHVSPFFTVACLRLGLGPDQVTLTGAALGLIGAGLLFLPMGWWSVLAVACLQVGYVLDFSDGQVARVTGRMSMAGAYLDWLTHFYVPVAVVLAIAASLAWAAQEFAFLLLGAVAALELAAFAWSGKEHLLVAMQRKDPALGASAAFHAALRDDARPADVMAATGQAQPESAGGISGRAHGGSLRSLIGELLIYPGSVHLVTLAVVVDLVAAPWLSVAVSARGALLVLWACSFPIHLFLTVRRNHRLLREVERRRQSDD